jgi:type IV secretion system T-DNA border endonuclease VirD2
MASPFLRALVKLRARLRTEGSSQITQSDRRTNEQAIAVALGQEQLPPFIAIGTFRWQEIRRAYEQAADALDATGQVDDRELASDVRDFLNTHQRMNATPEVFAAHHARILAAEKSKEELALPDPPPNYQRRGR